MSYQPGLSITYSIVHSLGRAIVSGRYSGSEPLPSEGELANLYGVSRSAVREAVKVLSDKGLITARQRRGIAVQSEQQWDFLDPDILFWLLDRRFSHNLLHDLTQVRLAIEPKAAALAAKYSNEKRRSDMRDALIRIAASDIGEDDAIASEIAFQRALLRSSGNRFYEQLGAVTETAIRFCARMRVRTNTLPRAPCHKAILDAVIVGDHLAAESHTRTIIEEVLVDIGSASNA